MCPFCFVFNSFEHKPSLAHILYKKILWLDLAQWAIKMGVGKCSQL